MKCMLVTYQTVNRPYNQYAVVPNIYVSDLLGWLSEQEATIQSVTQHTPGTDKKPSVCLLPPEWPSYRACDDFMRTLELVALTDR